MSNLSYLEKLLNGAEIELLPLSSLCKLITTGKLNANAMEDNGAYPFFTCNKEPYRINTYAFDLEAILISGNGSQVGHLNYYNGKFNAYQRTYILGEFNENVDIMYVYYYLMHTLKHYIHKNSKKGSVPYITMPMLENFTFPIPCPDNPEKSLAIQSEIVRILDKFTALTAELTAELNMRKKQYNYYRDQLLSFEEGEVEWSCLSELTSRTSNIRWQETDEAYQYIDLSSVSIENNSIVQTTVIDSLSAPSRAQKLIQENDVIFATTRPTQMRVCLISSDYDNSIASTGYCILRAVPQKALPKWIYYCLTSSSFKHYLEENQSGSAYPAISDTKLKEFSIPVPSLEEQARIVALLDKFELLTNSITEGLPREIELRQKQYEYYRDLLLNFPKSHSNEVA
ncbi:restriction endonuclease subunit S [Proteus mirabilis]|uniref:restriction endonuclease subunit S n=1 Tax=Proteus mirabilis TaxID=584 RepID=UPI001B35CB38|nr:restriction endonuclease subunit S [Proteus mirabilis]MBQ0522358.1 restriction endonuclease subunit S [Proteus mirabilis]MDC9777122.1 restriction endonuclease subunit S [Proteus mirabilis]